MVWKNQFSLFEELITAKMAHFDEEMYERYALIKACDDPVCSIPEIENQSKMLFVYPLSDDTEHWWNRSYQMYFNSNPIVKAAAAK